MPFVLGVVAFVVLATILGRAMSNSLPENMARLTKPEIRDLAAQAGFTGQDLDIAVAIALAESSGDPAAVGDVALGGSIGLWQIYTVAHPEFAIEGLSDPAVNAAAAFQVYMKAGNSFTPWTTYKTGAYRRFISGDIAGGAGGSY